MDLQTAAGWISIRPPPKPKSTVALLRYYEKAGQLVRLRRGLYAHGTDNLDPWVLGSRLATDAVIAYEGALSFHRQCPPGFSISFLTQERATRFVFGDVVYQPMKIPLALRKTHDQGGEIVETERDGQRLRVTSPERTFVDLLDRLDLARSSAWLWDHFAATPIDLDRIITYACRLGSRLTTARLGYFLQRRGASEGWLADLRKHLPRSPSYFDRSDRAQGDRFFRRWNLVVPRALVKHIDSGKPLELLQGLPRHDPE